MQQRETERPHGSLRYKHGPRRDGQRGKGCRCITCRRADTARKRHRRRMIAYGQWETPPPAAGTQRRLQALMWNGWSLAQLAARLGCTRQVLGRKLSGRERATPATVAAVRVLYGQLWDQPPPQATRYERAAVTQARRRARVYGFVPLAAWDDDPGPHYLEDPAATPVPGWERGERREWGVVTEEAAELAGQGEHVEMIAARLGVKPSTVERTLERARSAA